MRVSWILLVIALLAIGVGAGIEWGVGYGLIFAGLAVAVFALLREAKP